MYTSSPYFANIMHYTAEKNLTEALNEIIKSGIIRYFTKTESPFMYAKP